MSTSSDFYPENSRLPSIPQEAFREKKTPEMGIVRGEKAERFGVRE
ncbi:hypothetical protein [Microbulbifer sp. 2205BS26-8]|nr:hypothetical protein [Microbulbifer sp. 2205BS26-8]MDP5210824.1 hypothetical protein [Microbulbifer sp. 2205BS26-8]